MSLTVTNLSKAKKSQIIKNTAIVLSIPLVLTLVFIGFTGLSIWCVSLFALFLVIELVFFEIKIDFDDKEQKQ